MAYKIGVVGYKESVMAFKLIGFDVHYVETEKAARLAIDQLARLDYGIIYVSDRLLSQLPDVVDHYKSLVRPAVISIPTHEGSNGYGQQKIQEYVEKAVGQNIL